MVIRGGNEKILISPGSLITIKSDQNWNEHVKYSRCLNKSLIIVGFFNSGS